MALSIGIVGLPNVGKSTLFKAVTNKQVDIQNYPFTTIEPNVGVVAVPDKRVDALALFSNSAKKIYTTIDFTDIAGLVKGAAQGEGLGNKFLANIREVDAVAQVVRAFEDKNITHVHNRIDPADDISIINMELALADTETVASRIEKTSRMARGSTPEHKKAAAEMVLLEKFRTMLSGGQLLSSFPLTEDEISFAKELNLLTAKKFIYVINISEQQLIEKWEPDQTLKKVFGDSPYILLCAKLEQMLSESTSDERAEYMAEFNIPESGLDHLIRVGYKTLNLLTFLTTGEDESRAWTAHTGDLIPRAVRAIHTDFEHLFIRADVIDWKVLLEAGSYSNARSHGLIHTVGKDYVIKDGDVVEVRI